MSVVRYPVGSHANIQPLGTTRLLPAGLLPDIGLGQTIAIGQATETDLAQPITISKAKTVGQALETDLAQGVTTAKAKTVGQALELDEALAMIVVGGAPIIPPTKESSRDVPVGPRQPTRLSGSQPVRRGQRLPTRRSY